MAPTLKSVYQPGGFIKAFPQEKFPDRVGAYLHADRCRLRGVEVEAMTKRAFISQADLQRMAKVAKLEGVTVWVEIDGKKVGVSPNIPRPQSPKQLNCQMTLPSDECRCGNEAWEPWPASHSAKPISSASSGQRRPLARRQLWRWR
ncbi:hypothetical protein A9Z06_33390 [Rhizobium sp. YK2]|nr:hypothetical protein A9Z06_33390 [Rhizobium sp. YK2]